ncbi:QueT transporter family protein [Scatolibacter rhodanostii]|uniref:QueT transporter family protein n=1 Tax=Scatolibacter rhodanostii TaxID=2014781 RepID=UPI000C084F04|nr:QueT transporter family protein [Scatolibacter rhodanostii]
MQNLKKVRYLVQAAVIAALYAALTYVANALNLAYGPVQFRFSEALTLLAVFTPAAIPGLTVGCFLSNLTSPFGVVDWIFGSLATFLAVVCSRQVSKIRFKDTPILSPFMPVLFNAVIIGFEIACFSSTNQFSFAHFSWPVFFANALSVGAGELVVCYALGLPFYFAIRQIHSKYPKLLTY